MDVKAINQVPLLVGCSLVASLLTSTLTKILTDMTTLTDTDILTDIHIPMAIDIPTNMDILTIDIDTIHDGITVQDFLCTKFLKNNYPPVNYIQIAIFLIIL